MARGSRALRFLIRHPGRFAWRVVTRFRENQGVLLSGAVAYYTLLSLVPMFSLLLVVLSTIIDERRLLSVLEEALKVMVPGEAAPITAEVATFLEHRDVIGVFGVLVMIFFSGFAFTVLENAMLVIFHHRRRRERRHFLTSALLPYAFIALLGVGMLMVTVISGLVQAGSRIGLGDMALEVDATGAAVIYAFGVVGLICMLTAIYLVMPVGKISFSHALLGGVSAAILWEALRHVLVWYLSTLSMVNVIYGSLTTAIVALLSLELAGMIVLIGAQVIAEYDRLGHELSGDRPSESDEDEEETGG